MRKIKKIGLKKIKKRKAISGDSGFGKNVKDAVAGKVGVASMKKANLKKRLDAGAVLEKYSIKSEGNMDVSVRIKKKGSMVVYDLEIPDVDSATKLLLEDVRNELISITTVGMREIVDPDAVEGLRKKFIADASKVLEIRMSTK